MKTYAKKRIDIVIETPLLAKVIARLDAADVSGYSVMPIAAGRGMNSDWSAQGQIGSANQMSYVMCVIDAARLDAVLDAIFTVVARQIGFITTSDVEVIRPDRF